MNPANTRRNISGTSGSEVNSASNSSTGSASAVPSPVVETRELRKVFGLGTAQQVVLNSIQLSVAEGEMVAVMGPSGSGKSTLLHLLAALDMPTSGTVYFRSRALHSLSEAPLADYRNQSVGFVWQRHHLLPDFTAAENVAMPLLMRGAKRAAALELAASQLDQVGLADKKSQRAGELSGGEQQRVAIARALVNQPELLLADEPTGDLDERNADGVFELMQRLHRAHRLTSILATHNRALAERCDRVLGLEQGELKLLGGQSTIQPVH
ncbi:MAG TPA: ABC transporter ATP-binding protein [Candidatus Acidoferrales bacterium]|nr:ABC transporter ATP-binding protein [Candidatus Acidoferrales bacterium]